MSIYQKLADFSQINIGDQANLVHQVTQDDVDTFASLTGDFNALHTDKDFARQTPFGKPVVHGMLSAAFISTLIGTLLPGHGALWMSQTLEFLQPAYVGDTLYVSGTVRRKSPGTQILVLDIVIENQYGNKIVSGEAKVKMLEIIKEKMVHNNDRQIALVIGGGRGIGAAIARKLAQDGFQVVINYLSDKNSANELVSEIKTSGGHAIAWQANVANPDEVQVMMQHIQQAVGEVDTLVFCAAPESRLEPFHQMAWETIQKQIDVQIKGAYHCAKNVLPAMVEQGNGTIIFLGSIVADEVPPPNQLDYVIAKAALAAFARSLALEYGPKGIRVNTVSPGMTRTERIARLPDKARLLAKASTPLRRLATPEDVAYTVSFLVSPGARHITGETIRVAGGIVMK